MAHSDIFAISRFPVIERGATWQWTLRLKSEPSRIVGCIDLRTQENDNRGFWLGLPWQGQGLMSEASDAVTDFWFESLNFPVLRAPQAMQNLASRGSSEKQGMRIIAVEGRDYVSGGFPAELSQITAENGAPLRTAGPVRPL